MPTNNTLCLSFLSLCILVLATCKGQVEQSPQPESAPDVDEATAELMGEHFSQVMVAQRAIIRGDLEGVRRASQWLAEHQTLEGLPEEWGPCVEEMKSAARLAGEARTFMASAAATAAMLRTCGECHTAVEAQPRVPELGAKGLPPADQIDTVPHMLRHQWAVEQLCVGLINPWEDSWKTGIQVLADAPLEPQRMTDDAALAPDVGGWAQAVHEIGAKAAQSEDWAERALFYGELLATCTQCHQTLHIALE